MKRVIAAAVILAGLAVAPAARAATPQGRERFIAFAVDLGSPYGASTNLVQITVDRWSTPDEQRRLESVFSESGPDALLKAVQKLKPVGRLSTAGSLGYDLRFAYQVPLASGGRRIVLGTDRPLGFHETTYHSRSLDYPFTVLEMRVDDNGRGQGNMVLASRVTSLGETIEVENYRTHPVRLMQVRLDN